MELITGTTYSTKDMQQFFGMSKENWKKQKNKLLENFGYYYTYKVIYEGKNTNYMILEKLGEYQPPQKKGKKRDDIYEQGIIEIIEEDNIQTAANVARRLEKENKSVQALNHSSGTTYEYTRTRMRNMFGVKVSEGGSKGMISGKQWCRLNKEFDCYEPMSNEAINNFFEIYNKSREAKKDFELEIFCDYQNGLITKEEMYEAIGEQGFLAFQTARKTFNEKYGYFPIKVPVYEIAAFNVAEGAFSF